MARLRSAGVPLPRIAAIIGASTPRGGRGRGAVVLARRRGGQGVRPRGHHFSRCPSQRTGQHDEPLHTLDISLADLIARLYDELPDADDLARISEARRRAQSLADLGDQLVDHYVSEAKLGGSSWNEISDALGETNQSARQRHAPHAFSGSPTSTGTASCSHRSPRATHRHELIGSEHLLLGLLDEPRGLAYEVLVANGESEQGVRDAIERAMPPAGKEALLGHIAFSADSKEAIEQALRASSELGHDWVGTEHTLLGLIRVEDSLAAQILRDLGFTPDTLRDLVMTGIARRLAAVERVAAIRLDTYPVSCRDCTTARSRGRPCPAATSTSAASSSRPWCRSCCSTAIPSTAPECPTAPRPSARTA